MNKRQLYESIMKNVAKEVKKVINAPDKNFNFIIEGDNLEALKMGVDYLRIICCFSFGQIIYTIVERFLQSTGKTILSTISQITGSVINIVLDYIFIYPLHMGIQGAAWATVIGQIVSLILGLTFHFLKNKSIKTKFKDLKGRQIK